MAQTEVLIFEDQADKYRVEDLNVLLFSFGPF